MQIVRWLALFGILGIFPSFADGFILINDLYDPAKVVIHPRHPRPPHPPFPHPIPPIPPYAFAPLAVAYHQVDVKIEDPIALTAIDQEFVNPSGARLEGTYIFPLPVGAQIEKFSMFIDGKEAEAELLSADKAREIYEGIVRQMRDPALLEYSGRDILKARIFPIEPHGRKRVRISYRQVLKSDGDLVEYVYPLNTEKFSSKPIDRVGIKVDLTGKAPFKNVYSPSHKVEVKRHDDRHVTVGYEEKGTRPSTDFHLYFSRDAKDLGVTALCYRPKKGEDGYFLLLASPSLALESREVSDKDVVFVIDTSGSMAGPKLEQAKKALRFCIENLNAGDRFEIVRFSTEAEALFNGLKGADADRRKAAHAFVDDFKPIGGTAIDEALQKGLSLRPADASRPFMVIFLTDGQPTVGETNEDAIVSKATAKNAASTRIFCFGIGTDINTHLLDRITEATRSAGEYVLPEEDIEVKVSRFYTRIKSPVLTGPKLSWGVGVRPTKIHPNPVADLFSGDQIVLFGRYGGSGPVAITVEGLVQGKPRSFVVEANFPEEAADKPWVAKLWATRRVGYLLNEIRLRGESAELKEEVTTLAREHGIVTPYTAYLILEDEDRRVTQGRLHDEWRALKEFAGDREAQSAARGWYNAQRDEKTGRHAVESRNDASALQGMDAVAGEAPPAEAFRRGLGKGKESAAAGGPSNYAEQVRTVRAKTFYQNGATWTDAEVQKRQDAKRVQVKFGSDAYFALARRSLDLAEWLSQGVNVQVALEDAVYEIVE